ncbi:uncharacterized protein SCHCODRAFT_02671899 [Schizophyllum commune H4-8]|nr:uncharacterized protein SCHCODRAFT_02671899 [Schizophyllum commune H4-8]KAI5887973.1 hypothetical protein SCHCODRAFT_02671899 [Schizophyllum commune H4-8]
MICAELQHAHCYGSLAAFAAANTLICDIALDAIWQHQDNLVYLLMTLPEHHIQGLHPWDDLRLVIDGPITPEGWARLHSYASRIAKLDLRYHNGGISAFYTVPVEGGGVMFRDLDISITAFEQITCYARSLSADEKGYPGNAAPFGTPAIPHTLFPRLRNLDCTVFKPKSLSRFPVLLSPSITSLSIRISKDAEWLVRDLPNICPGLRTLSWHGFASLGGKGRDRALPHPPPELLRRLRTLETLITSDLCIKMVECATKLPSLHSLQFFIGGDFVREVDAFLKTPAGTLGMSKVNAMTPPSPSLHFSNAMRHIKLELEDRAGLVMFFKIVQNPLKVTAFDAECYEEEYDDGADVRVKNLALLAQTLDPAHLRQLLYYHDCDIELSRGPVPVVHVLRLAQRYPNLSYLGIDCWLDLADADHIELARALPQLEYFALDTHAIDNGEYLDIGARNVRTTLGVLPAFAHYCPQLRSLCIRLDATEIPALDEGGEEPRLRGHVRMYFAHSELSDPVAVARFLRQVFVRGCSIASWPPREGMYKRRHDQFWDDAEVPRNWAVGQWLEVRKELVMLEHVLTSTITVLSSSTRPHSSYASLSEAMSLRCLDLPEIAILICAELQRSQAYGSLTAFAATNTLICDIALDALWQWQNNLVFLFKTLPQHRIEEIHPWDLRLVIDDPITPEGWARMHSYASRITNLDLYKPNGGTSGIYPGPEVRCLDNYYDLDIDDGAFEMISSHAGWMADGAGLANCPRLKGHGMIAIQMLTPATSTGTSAIPQPPPARAHTLFPRLRNLDCTMFAPRSLALFPAMFSPTITSLALRMSKDAEWLARDLPDLCPDLKTLSWRSDVGLRGSERDRALPHPPPELLCRLRDMECFIGSGVCIETLAGLARHPAIHSLQFLVDEEFIREVDTSMKDDVNAFPPCLPLQFRNTMRHIKLDLDAPAALARFFRVVQTPLQVIAFDAQCWEVEADDPHDVRTENLDLLAQAFDPAHVKQILYYHDRNIELSWGPIPFERVLRLARYYPSLSYLAIDCWLDVEDADLVALARALPHLEYLVLDTHAMNHREYLTVERRDVHTTLGVLPAFAHYCPRLRGLCIRLDATELPALDLGADKPRVQGHVRMYFADSKLSHPVAVARFLRDVFAQGCSIASQPPREGMYKRWRDGFWDDAETSDWAVGRWLEVRKELATLEREVDRCQ